MKHQTLVLLLFILSLFGIVFSTLNFPISLGASNPATIEIYVNISPTCLMDVSVSSLSWVQIAPGSVGSPQTFAITSKGSQNITSIWAAVDTEGSKPDGANPLTFEAGSFLVLHNNTESTYYFVDRREWNLTDTEKPSDATVESGAVSCGYFRNSSFRYFWGLKNGTTINATHGCNSTGTSLRINDTAGNLSAANGILCGNLQTGDRYSACSYATGPLAGYNVLINQSCDFIQIYKFDWNSTFPVLPSANDNRRYLVYQTLIPDASTTIYANVWVAEGVPYGDLSNSTLTITANCA